MINEKLYIYTFYRFIYLKKIKIIKKNLEKKIDNNLLRGTILLAPEGINGTISGTKKNLESFILLVKHNLKIRKLSVKKSSNQFIPFYRMKIRIKKEIVTIGDKKIKPEIKTGKYISPENWDKIINNDKYLVIDTRNNYEVDIGTFKNSINPKLKSFRDFPNYIKKLKIDKNKPIAMFCTGGIRCEKASSYLLNNGYKNIFQLEGGILHYLEINKNKKTSLWNGECFVFDNRVALDKNLKKGSYDQCYGCRHPITESDKKLNSYQKGISCKYCITSKSKKKIKSSQSRQNQINIAERENKYHPFKKIYGKN